METVSEFDVIVFDMDGVLAEVSESYREGVVQTVKHFTGQDVTRETIQDYKNAGGWNNDWALSQELCKEHNVEVPYEDVVEYFNLIFIGNHGDGLIAREGWFPEPGFLEQLAANFTLAVFTGRLQYEADITLRRFAPTIAFNPLLCADHVERSKPAPDGLHMIQQQHPGKRLVYVGDTIDDARCASAAGVPFIGIVAANHLTRDEIVRLFQEERAIAICENVNEIQEALEKTRAASQDQ